MTMATAKIWHYVGHVADEANSHTQMAREPYVSRQQVTTSATAASSTASPAGTNLARIEVTTATRYRVIAPDDEETVADENDPLLLTNDNVPAWNWIHCPPGWTISLIEAA
jgi:hypothetical protein